MTDHNFDQEVKDLVQKFVFQSFNKDKVKSKADLISDTIIKLIQKGYFKKDIALPSEMELASLLGVGRSSIREAVKLLVSQNILEIRRGLGTYVSEHTGVLPDPFGFRFYKDKLKLGLDLCEIRLMIEPSLAQNAALHANPLQIEKITSAHNEIKDLIYRGINHEDADVKLHSAIASCSKNCVLPSIMDIIYAAINYVINLNNRTLCQEAIETHEMIVNAIIKKDGDAAFHAMELHLNQIRDDVLKRQKASNENLTDNNV